MSRIALASGATGDDPAPPSIRLLSAEELAEHERLNGRTYAAEPCDCGDCLSCDVRAMGQHNRDCLVPDIARFVLGAEL